MNNEERLTLEESEDERRSLCIEIGQQTSEIWRVQAKLDTCVAALKAALSYVRDQWVEDRPGVMETLEAAIALAEGRQP